MRPTDLLVLCLALPALTPIGCVMACDREGCAAGDHPATDVEIGQGLAGVAFSESDVVANGCQTCTLSQGTLQVWASAQPIETRDQALALAAGAAADETVDIDERYELALDPGHWLACVGSSDLACAAIDLAADDVVSVHARFVYGPPGIVVFEPGADDPRTDGLFEIGSGELP
jgi:hypothetical protein